MGNVTEEDRKTIARILKVNHAGEYGAIRIYRAQLLVIGLFFKELAPQFRSILGHEVAHCDKFKAAMLSRNARPCRAMWFWSIGGYLLGLATALMGRNAIMACTEAVESAVHVHMSDQIIFLKDRDAPLRVLIEEIKVEELEHLHYAEQQLKPGLFAKILQKVVTKATDTVIWLSTQGDVSRMKQGLKTAGTAC